MSTPASSATSSAVASRQYCTFRADGLLLGVAVTDVQEVLRAQPMTPAPLAPGEIRGLLNLRGQIVTAIDLRDRLGLRRRSTDATSMNVVIHSRGEIVTLLVDEIGEVIDTADAAVEQVPSTLPTPLRDALVGVVPLPDSLLLVLDAHRAADVAATRNPGGTP